MFICAAGDIHGAMDRLYDDVLAFEESLGMWRRGKDGSVRRRYESEGKGLAQAVARTRPRREVARLTT